MQKHQLLRDLVLERYKSIGEFYRSNIDHKMMPTRDKLYRIMNKDIRDTDFKECYAILSVLDVVKSMPALTVEIMKGEEDYYDLLHDRYRDKGVSDQ